MLDYVDEYNKYYLEELNTLGTDIVWFVVAFVLYSVSVVLVSYSYGKYNDKKAIELKSWS